MKKNYESDEIMERIARRVIEEYFEKDHSVELKRKVWVSFEEVFLNDKNNGIIVTPRFWDVPTRPTKDYIFNQKPCNL